MTKAKHREHVKPVRAPARPCGDIQCQRQETTIKRDCNSDHKGQPVMTRTTRRQTVIMGNDARSSGRCAKPDIREHTKEKRRGMYKNEARESLG